MNNTGPYFIIHLQLFEMVFWKRTRSFVTGKMDDGIPLSFSDSEMTFKKNHVPHLKPKWKNIFYLFNQRMIHYLRLGQKYLHL